MKTSERNVYLKMKTRDQARALIEERFGGRTALKVEHLAVPEAVGRVLAEAVDARLSSPAFHAAAMDGMAVRAADTFGARETRPLELALGSQAVAVNTGQVLPESCDAVIMIEHIQEVAPDRIRIEAPAFPWQHVRKMGEDIVATELLFPRRHRISPYCVGALLAGGVFEVPVVERPRVMVIPTGSELVDWRRIAPEELRPGQVIESNSFVVGKLIEACGACWERHEKLPDDEDRIRRAIGESVAAGFQLVLTVGGSSAGSADFTRRAVGNLGEVLVHGVTVMPGKPLLVGEVSGCPIFGLPGYPVSAIIAFEQFVRPLICNMLGLPEPEPSRMSVEPTRKIASRLGVEEFVRVKLGRVDERLVATPLPRGAGCITSLTEADGILRIPNEVEGLRDGTAVTAELLKPVREIQDTIVVVGSHDNTLDVLADELKAADGRLSLSSSHVGSLGGLMAIRRGVCHLAGAHLLDESDGSYNVSWVRRYLPDRDILLVNLVLRQQGLILPSGNPKGIGGMEDLARKDVTMVNRQAGSGTRILLDYRLRQMGIDPQQVAGYADEEFTHMSVAAAVLSGRADTGLGIFAAARALRLDFIPVVTEQYDLVIPREHYQSEKLQRLLEVIVSETFQNRVRNLGGYSTEKTGKITEVRPAADSHDV